MTSLQNPIGAPQELIRLVKAYNDVAEENSINKLFYLQKINHFLHQTLWNMQSTPSHEHMLNWKNEVGASSFEAHLQRYGIHRDSSVLLQNIEFAHAVSHFAPKESTAAPELSLFDAIKARDAALKNENVPSYVQQNLAIVANYNKDVKLQEKIARHIHFLGLSYAKIEAIQGFVQQTFGYQTEVLGKSDGNNKNFILNVDGSNERTVIRVEDRERIGRERIGQEFELQNREVSQYFSEDYATLMVLVKVDEDKEEYRPFVISEFAKKGDLDSYSKSLNPQEAVSKAQHFIGQLNDFCLKLMSSGYYHPDIKLTNFLTDSNRIIISDRKAFTNKREPRVIEIASSFSYGAPEYKQCFTEEQAGISLNRPLASKTYLHMPSYMAFQMGMALKEFMFNSLGIKDEDLLFSPTSLLQILAQPSQEIQNISLLIQELTRDNPADRLTIENFQTLLKQVNLPHHEFFALFEAFPSIEAVKELLKADQLSPELEAKIANIPAKHCKAPMLLAVLAEQSHIKNYCKKIEEALYNETPLYSKILYNITSILTTITFGLVKHRSIESINALANLNKLPTMDKLTQAFFSIYTKLSDDNIALPGFTAQQQKLLQQIIKREFPEKTMTTSSATITESLGKATIQEPAIIAAEDSMNNQKRSVMVHNDEEESVVQEPAIIVIKDSLNYQKDSVMIHDDEEKIVLVDGESSVIVQDEERSVKNDKTGSVMIQDNETTSTDLNQGQAKKPAFFYTQFEEPVLIARDNKRKIEGITETVTRGNSL